MCLTCLVSKILGLPHRESQYPGSPTSQVSKIPDLSTLGLTIPALQNSGSQHPRSEHFGSQHPSVTILGPHNPENQAHIYNPPRLQGSMRTNRFHGQNTPVPSSVAPPAPNLPPHPTPNLLPPQPAPFLSPRCDGLGRIEGSAQGLQPCWGGWTGQGGVSWS